MNVSHENGARQRASVEPGSRRKHGSSTAERLPGSPVLRVGEERAVCTGDCGLRLSSLSSGF